ncbi:MAG: 16S rRNA (guanine(966)-N(2))-methyltransferase RsmD [Candidatus Saccharimonadales bacterium]
MRIIAGSLKGRVFDSPKSHKTHPMSDKMRGALFNMLGDLQGLRVLDAFAGSGALGFEAVSRGAAEVVAIDNDRQAQQTITKNIRQLGLGTAISLVKAGAGACLGTAQGKPFDIVLCDPPYNDLQPNLLARLAEVVAPNGGLFVLSWPGGQELPVLPGLALIRHRQYGDGSLGFYRRQRIGRFGAGVLNNLPVADGRRAKVHHC